MGYKLYREARDFLPPDCTPGELVVAWVIADDARDETRRSFIDAGLLAMRTRLSARGIRAALQKLGDKGYEFRVEHGKGSDGRPVYAARNHPPDYYVPLIADIRAARMGDELAVDNRSEGGTDRSPSLQGRRHQGVTFSREGGTDRSPSGPKAARTRHLLGG